jgi:hypothetical protein
VSKGYDVLYDPKYASQFDHEHVISQRFSDPQHHEVYNESEEPNYLHSDHYYIDHYDHDFHHLSHPKRHYWDQNDAELDENYAGQFHTTREHDTHGHDHDAEYALLRSEYDDYSNKGINPFPMPKSSKSKSKK